MQGVDFRGVDFVLKVDAQRSNLALERFRDLRHLLHRYARPVCFTSYLGVHRPRRRLSALSRSRSVPRVGVAVSVCVLFRLGVERSSCELRSFVIGGNLAHCLHHRLLLLLRRSDARQCLREGMDQQRGQGGGMRRATESGIDSEGNGGGAEEEREKRE